MWHVLRLGALDGKSGRLLTLEAQFPFDRLIGDLQMFCLSTKNKQRV